MWRKRNQTPPENPTQKKRKNIPKVQPYVQSQGDDPEVKKSKLQLKEAQLMIIQLKEEDRKHMVEVDESLNIYERDLMEA